MQEEKGEGSVSTHTKAQRAAQMIGSFKRLVSEEIMRQTDVNITGASFMVATQCK